MDVGNDRKHYFPPVPKLKRRNRKGALNFALLFASLNIKERGSSVTHTKWYKLCQLIKENDIDILMIQEMHLDTERTNELITLFQRQAHFISSLDLSTPNVKEVAFIISKRTTKWEEVRSRVLIPGKALKLEVLWHKRGVISCLNIYAPNQLGQNSKF